MKALALAVLLTAAACAPAIQSSGLQPVVTERLYFGRNVAQTLGVTDSAWAVFVTDRDQRSTAYGIHVLGGRGRVAWGGRAGQAGAELRARRRASDAVGGSGSGDRRDHRGVQASVPTGIRTENRDDRACCVLTC